MKNQVNIALLGFGVVGSGTLQLLKQQKKEIESRVGARVRVRWVCSRHRKNSPLIDKSVRQTTRWRDVIADPLVDCVVELIGGTEPARSIVLSALQSGKHVVTANKAILAKHWDQIFGLAHRQKKLVYFEAAVGGGIPVVQALNEGLAGNHIRKIVGILNGTTNFILTQMQESGVDFKSALKEAQRQGFVEANPTFDIEGIDAAQKISILGSLATGRWIHPKLIHCEGISHLKTKDIQLIQSLLQCSIKLLGIAELTVKGWIFRVHPTLVSNHHPFANVRNEYNAISLHGNAADDVMLYGRGAGRLATSSAVVSDIIFLCRQVANGTAGQLPYVTSLNNHKVKLAPMSQVRSRYYLRITTLDKPGVLSHITGVLGKHNVSLASVHQDTSENGNAKKAVAVILLTHKSREADVQSCVKAIDCFSSTRGKTVLLRME